MAAGGGTRSRVTKCEQKSLIDKLDDWRQEIAVYYMWRERFFSPAYLPMEKACLPIFNCSNLPITNQISSSSLLSSVAATNTQFRIQSLLGRRHQIHRVRLLFPYVVHVSTLSLLLGLMRLTISAVIFFRDNNRVASRSPVLNDTLARQNAKVLC